jgi:hypothetical protein
MKKIKTIAAKAALIILRVSWGVVLFGITMWVLFQTASLLSDAIPAGTSGWVRFAIGVPCIFVAPVSVELLLITISRRLDRMTNHRLLNIH